MEGGGAATGDVSAFRAAEKKYRLRRGGRRGRGKEGQVTGTDFSEVVVLPREADGAAGVNDSRIVDIRDGSGRTAAYSLKGHPGLYIFPGALCVQEQLELIRQAWESWPEPPASTNLTAHYGDLQGLWMAAGQHLRLRTNPQVVVPCGASATQGTESQGRGCSGGMPENGNGCCCYYSTFGGRWTTLMGGPTAVQLLKKLRWASLGPRYDWGERRYDDRGPHQELPEQLKRIGERFAQRVAQIEGLWHVDRGNRDATICLQGGSEKKLDCQDALLGHFCGKERQIRAMRGFNERDLDVNQTGAVLKCNGSPSGNPAQVSCGPGHVCDDVSCAGTSCQEGNGTHHFRPDAALINYYNEGSTLCGHKDDVECDLTQPIVSLSLGCPAVFLIGGSLKEIAPTAVMLSSGDVLVMSGPARSCFHGVPCILSEQRLPQALQVGTVQGDCAPYVAALEGMRINVSIRAVSS